MLCHEILLMKIYGKPKKSQKVHKYKNKETFGLQLLVQKTKQKSRKTLKSKKVQMYHLSSRYKLKKIKRARTQKEQKSK